MGLRKKRKEHKIWSEDLKEIHVTGNMGVGGKKALEWIFREIVYESVGWPYLAQDNDQYTNIFKVYGIFGFIEKPVSKLIVRLNTVKFLK